MNILFLNERPTFLLRQSHSSLCVCFFFLCISLFFSVVHNTAYSQIILVPCQEYQSYFAFDLFVYIATSLTLTDLFTSSVYNLPILQNISQKYKRNTELKGKLSTLSLIYHDQQTDKGLTVKNCIKYTSCSLSAITSPQKFLY